MYNNIDEGYEKLPTQLDPSLIVQEGSVSNNKMEHKISIAAIKDKATAAERQKVHHILNRTAFESLMEDFANDESRDVLEMVISDEVRNDFNGYEIRAVQKMLENQYRFDFFKDLINKKETMIWAYGKSYVPEFNELSFREQKKYRAHNVLGLFVLLAVFGLLFWMDWNLYYNPMNSSVDGLILFMFLILSIVALIGFVVCAVWVIVDLVEGPYRTNLSRFLELPIIFYSECAEDL
jgi:Fe2+ transport system protein B